MTFYHCERDVPDPAFCHEDVHAWFELTYASYLTVPRVLLEQMPAEWQHAFARLMDEMAEHYRAPLEGEYAVLLRGEAGRYAVDPLRNYRYPDRSALALSRRQPPVVVQAGVRTSHA